MRKAGHYPTNGGDDPLFFTLRYPKRRFQKPAGQTVTYVAARGQKGMQAEEPGGLSLLS
jgi:hypothetical protein